MYTTCILFLSCHIHVFFSLVCSMSQGFLHLFLLPVYLPFSYGVLHKLITHIRNHQMDTFHTNTLQHIKYSTTYTILILPSGLYHTYSFADSDQTFLIHEHIGPPDYYRHRHHIALTCDGLYAHTSTVYILIFCKYSVP